MSGPELTRPIIGIEYRTPQEVFDIMCDRIRGSAAPQPAPAVGVSDEMITAFAVAAQMGDANFVSSEPSIQRALDSSKARIKAGLEAALVAGRVWP